MVVSMLQVVINIPYASSLKDKRKIVKSLKERIIHRFKLSMAEVDLQDSVRYAQLGAALVSNSREHGEKVIQKVVSFIEDHLDGRMMDFSIFSQQF